MISSNAKRPASYRFVIPSEARDLLSPSPSIVIGIASNAYGATKS